jgi:hypothetical protein
MRLMLSVFDLQGIVQEARTINCERRGEPWAEHSSVPHGLACAIIAYQGHNEGDQDDPRLAAQAKLPIHSGQGKLTYFGPTRMTHVMIMTDTPTTLNRGWGGAQAGCTKQSEARIPTRQSQAPNTPALRFL